MKTSHALVGGGICNQFINCKIAATSRANAEWFFDRFERPTFDGTFNKLLSVAVIELPTHARCYHHTPAAKVAGMAGLTPDQKINCR